MRSFCTKPLFAILFQSISTDQTYFGPYLATFFRLWTMQNRFHWIFTFFFPRKVKRSSPMIRQMWAKGGSAMATRRLYKARPATESILCFIR